MFTGAFILSLIVRSMLLPSCSGYVDWIYPNAEMTGMTFNYIDVVYFTWTSNITNPWMKLWCTPSVSGNHSLAHEEHVVTNGTNPQSFPYSEYERDGGCYMELEYSTNTDIGKTPEFHITSNDAVSPQTWGPSTISVSGAASSPIMIASSSSSFSSFSQSSAGFSSSSTPPLATEPPATTPTRAATPMVSSSPSKGLSTAGKIGVSLGTIFGILVLIMTVSFLCSPSGRTRGEKRGPRGFRPNWQTCWYKIDDTAEIGEGVQQPSELQETPRPELDSSPQIELDSGSEWPSMDPPHSSP